jgi:hypothetical protein
MHGLVVSSRLIDRFEVSRAEVLYSSIPAIIWPVAEKLRDARLPGRGIPATNPVRKLIGSSWIVVVTFGDGRVCPSTAPTLIRNSQKVKSEAFIVAMF